MVSRECRRRQAVYLARRRAYAAMAREADVDSLRSLCDLVRLFLLEQVDNAHLGRQRRYHLARIG